MLRSGAAEFNNTKIAKIMFIAVDDKENYKNNEEKIFKLVLQCFIFNS